MGSVDGKGDLAAAMVAFYAPAFLIAVFVVFKHGFSRQVGWFYLVTLSILRIIGGSATLYMEVNNDYSKSLQQLASITSAIGTAPLLLALMGFQKRINDGMEPKGIAPRWFVPIQLVAIIALIVAIVGGTKASDTSSPSDLSTGEGCMKASSILFLVVFIVLVGITLYAITQVRWVDANDKMLLRATALALPFLLVRVIFSVCVGFSSPGGFFYFADVNIWAEAFMLFLMEAIVVSLFIFAGLMTPKQVKKEVVEGKFDNQKYPLTQQDLERGAAPQQEFGHATRHEQQQQQSQPRPQQQRNLNDYRPSRMIRNAMRS